MALENSKGPDLSKQDECTTENDGNGREVAIQTNPHEIERNRGQVPLRKRFIPVRFSDYGIFADNIKGEIEDIEVLEDTDFTPTEPVVKQVNKDDKQKRSRGRPKKNKDTSIVSTPGDGEGNGEEAVKRNPIKKVSNGFKCGICTKVFTLRGNAKTHLITHTDDRPFPCDFKGCGKNLRTKESLRRHKLSHLGVKTFECSECSKKFSCNLSLQEHMSLHTGQKPFTCDICGTKFRQVAVLKRHLTTHSNSKPFACDICGKMFSLKVYVRSHMKIHTGERPFACDVCNKCFAHASDLNRHKIIHSGKKPYKCTICPMRYSDPSSRRRHEREHTSKPQYVCHLCKQQFPRAGQLRVHLVKEHTVSTAPFDQHNAVQFPMKIESSDNQNDKVSSITWDPSVDNANSDDGPPRVVNLQPAVGLGQEVNTVQIVLESTDTSQIDKNLMRGLQAVPSGHQVQTVVMELPQHSADDFPSLPGTNGTMYKVINADNSVFEIEVDKDASSCDPFQGQDVNNEMKMKIVSDLKMSDGRLVAVIQDGDTVTVMEQPDHDAGNTNTNTSHQSSVGADMGGHDGDLVVHGQGGEDSSNGVAVNGDAAKVVEYGNGAVVEEDASINNKEAEKVNTMDSVNTPTGQQDVLIKYNEQQGSIDHSVTQSQVLTTSQTYTVSENHNSPTQLPHDTAPTSSDSNSNNGYPLADIATVESGVITISSTSAVHSSFVQYPDLSSQDYYNWLSSFSEECKHFALPLPKDVFTSISQVQKTLTDFMASPTGVITDKNNFKILMGISQDLSHITSSHLSFMYSNLNT